MMAVAFLLIMVSGCVRVEFQTIIDTHETLKARHNFELVCC
jgi:hypothetical protein